MTALPLTIEALHDQITNSTEDQPLNYTYLLFWGHTKKATKFVDKSCLSQWYPADFTIDGVKYTTAEHYMMAQKALLFKNQDIYEQIINETKPAKVKLLGRQVTDFDEDIWAKHRFDIVLKGNIAKFSQNEVLSNFLIQGCLDYIPTDQQQQQNTIVFVEASPFDAIWGIGMGETDPRASNPLQWAGSNLLGFVLTATRAALLDAVAKKTAQDKKDELIFQQ